MGRRHEETSIFPEKFKCFLNFCSHFFRSSVKYNRLNANTSPEGEFVFVCTIIFINTGIDRLMDQAIAISDY
jgi:hypothetical protein